MYLLFDLMSKLQNLLIELVVDIAYKSLITLFHNAYVKQVKRYNKTIKSPEFVFFENTILEKYYHDAGMLTLYGEKYPVYCFKGEQGLAYPYDNFCLKDNLRRKSFSHNRIKYYARYKYINKTNNTVKRPQMQGYMLDKLHFDTNGRVKGISSWVGTYANNVYSSHILEYEIYELYKKYGKYDFEHDEKIKQLIISKMKIRNKYHQGKSTKEVLSSGCERASLLGVQLLVIFKDSADHKYKLIIARRSDDVAVKPGFYQLLPSGGFELYENMDEHSKYEHIKNFSIMTAVYRELLEELFGAVEFKYAENGETLPKIWKHPVVKQIDEMIHNGMAYIEFLGSAVEYNYLRNELSFVLLINDEKFSDQYFKSNHESKKIYRCEINEILDIIEDKKKLNPASAAMLYMFYGSDMYTKMIRDNYNCDCNVDRERYH